MRFCRVEQGIASRITCSILFVAELTTRDLVTWPRRPRKAATRQSGKAANRRVNSHVITTKHVAVTRFGYRATNIWPYNEIAIRRLIVACWHIPRRAGGRRPKAEGGRRKGWQRGGALLLDICGWPRADASSFMWMSLFAARLMFM